MMRLSTDRIQRKVKTASVKKERTSNADGGIHT